MAPTVAQEKCPNCGHVQPAGKEICEKCANFYIVADKNVADKPDEFDAAGNPLKGGKKKDAPKEAPKKEKGMKAAEAPKPKPEKKDKK
jgi:hypothetical protein